MFQRLASMALYARGGLLPHAGYNLHQLLP